MRSKIDEGRVVLGGCCIIETNPDWACSQCDWKGWRVYPDTATFELNEIVKELENNHLGNLDKEIRRLMPEPVNQQMVGDREDLSEYRSALVGGDPGEIIVDLGLLEIKVSEFSVRWNGPHTPVVRPINTAIVDCHEKSMEQILKEVRRLIQRKCKNRKSKYRTCKYCQESNPPEWIISDVFDGTVCHSCAEQHEGIVF
ncbi:hypothetical protein [Rubinisphaera italica]|uniref:Uncharacterized protein n=1 Tax=Rubinisphaera italica TaxID=2527969 RepID=A0A5C5XKI6_9PLAN|nr:hypothetical protein [Rubinisphaera italica]TWT62893.1 hypothetical protein Pan54_36400 [Rubinisphaera italica]